MKSPEGFSAYGGRHEYNQTQEDKLEECLILTDEIDEILAAPTNIGSDEQARAVASSTGTNISRSFHYIEADQPNGWAWPLTETVLDIRYARDNASNLHTEVYEIKVGSVIHQQDVSKDPIVNIFRIVYYGKNRESVVATIEQPNFVEKDAPNFLTRDTTPYDHIVLFEQLASFSRLAEVDRIHSQIPSA